MANADHIAGALFSLEEQVTAFEVLLDAFDSVAQDNPPSWLVVMSDQFSPLKDSIDRMGDLVRRDVLPLQRDMQSLTRAQGGMGAVAPMVAKVPAGQSINSRK